MTVSSSTSKAGPYAGNGVTTAFAFSFYTIAGADISVIKTDAAGADAALTPGVDYAVSLNADQTTSPGGTVTLTAAPAAGYQITVLRNINLTQNASLPNQGGFYPQVIEKALDKLTMGMQQLAEKVSRAVVSSVTIDPTALLQSIFSAVANTAASASAASGSATAAANSATAAANSAAASAASAAVSGIPVIAGNGTILTNDGTTPLWSDTYRIAVNEKKGADIASAATINLTAATGNYVHVTGTTAITAITIPAGAERTVITDGALTITAGAALTLPGGAASLTTAANDRLIIRGDTAGAVIIAHIAGVASTSEVKAGSNPAKTVSPAALLAAAGFSAYFQSADQTITAQGLVTIAHGLGRTPVALGLYGRCTTSDRGWAVGDVIPLPIGASGASSSGAGIAAWADATNIYLMPGLVPAIILWKDGSNSQQMTFTAWKIFARAWA